MAGSIQDNKAKIKALRTGTKGAEKFKNASSELGAAVQATESAKYNILNITEAIEDLAGKIQLHADIAEDR